MDHRTGNRKLNKTTSHRLAMLRNMTTSLFIHGKIETTVPKAKELRRVAEKVITLSKKESLHSRRLASLWVRDKKILKKVFTEISPKYASRNGGYTRIIRTRVRRGDGAEMAIIELVE